MMRAAFGKLRALLEELLSTREPSPGWCCHLAGSLHSHVCSFSPMNIQPLTCRARTCMRVCACVRACSAGTCSHSLFISVLPSHSLHSPFLLFPSNSFFPVDSISYLCCLGNKTVPSTAFKWDSFIASFRLLLCLKTWGQGQQEERNANLRGVPVAWWERCWRGAQGLPLDVLTDTWRIDEGRSKLHPPPSPVSARVETRDLTRGCCVGPAQSLALKWLIAILPLSTLEERFPLRVCADADGCPRADVCLCQASFLSLPSSPITEMLFPRDHHWEGAVGGRDRVESPYNLTPRMSENVAQSKEWGSVSAGANWLGRIDTDVITKHSAFLLVICV